MGRYLKEGDVLEGWFGYVEHDPARSTVSTLRFEQDWKEVRKIAKESRTQKGKVDAARKTIIDKWGARATDMASAPAYNTLTKLRYIAKNANFDDGLALINRAILLRIRQNHVKGRP